MAVQIVQSLNELLGNLAYFRLAKVTVIFKDLEKFSLGKLSDHTELMRRLE